MNETSLERCLRGRLLPTVSIEREADAVALARALAEGGIDVVEILLRTPVAIASIGKIRTEVPQITVGAGTVLEPDQIDRVIEAGASFAVAPGLNEEVLSRAQDRALPFIPGVVTPTEIGRACALGVRRLKFFPAEALGGVKTLHLLASPFAHLGIRFIPTGGIDAANAAGYLNHPLIAAIGASWLADPQLIRAGEWDRITAIARDAVAMVAACSPSK